MTEKKPGEPDERDYAVGREILYGPATRQNARSVGKVIAAYREEIEARARREGAREALERALEAVALLRNKAQAISEWSPSETVRSLTASAACGLDDAHHAIRALADQPEAEGRMEKTCPRCGNLLYSHCLIERRGEKCSNSRNTCHAASYSCRLAEPEAPAKADTLPPTRCPHGYALDDDCLDCDGGPTPLGQYRGERPWRKPE